MLDLPVKLGPKLVQGPAAILSSPLFTRSYRQLLAFVSPCFQTLAHSFIFWITAIPRPSRRLRTLSQKTGGTPLRGHTTQVEGLARRSFSGGGLSPVFPLDTNVSLVSLLFPLLTQKRGSVPPPKNVGAPTFSIFRTFSVPPSLRSPLSTRLPAIASAEAGRWSPATGHFLCYPICRRPSRP
jgi:hypothetical protein